MIKENVARVKDQVVAICRRLGRNPSEITIIGVTKYADPPQVAEAISAGIAIIGENRVQEAEWKFPVLDTLVSGVRKHLIGHLQTNKVKQALKYFDLIQSVDSLKLALEIEKQCDKLNRGMDILVQVSTSGEEQKFGVEHLQATLLVEEIANLPHIFIKGLMTMAPLTEDKQVVRKTFADLRILRDQIKEKFPNSEKVQMKYLSMGMSSDYEIALEEGSNMVRIGSAIFK